MLFHKKNILFDTVYKLIHFQSNYHRSVCSCGRLCASDARDISRKHAMTAPVPYARQQSECCGYLYVTVQNNVPYHSRRCTLKNPHC